ncbi:hypothetical protein BDB00DRAFT_79218 [Zychaea mexicana]|uniref:uncharacterized protein n=1 Tax=Zychaea mexicana TaxID=64656 RepID=UPI0022FEFF70|nr:uncharacterized protein BDB00DRAFT_79218 [Zychaea mexicana]KAI9496911.1 hypothetical protein BDB00DRAFT_79218 [Zychaea mexicana]
MSFTTSASMSNNNKVKAVLQKKNAEFDDNSNSSNNIPGDLYSQHGQLRQILEKTLKQMQQSTEQRIKQFQQDQLQQLERASTQAKCDRNFLWQKILEASRTVNEEKQLRKRLSDPEHQLAEIGGHVRFAEQQQQAPSSSTASSYNATRPIVQHHQQQQPISTSSFITPASLRKSSFALDERVITSSWKNTSHLHHQGLGGGLGQAKTLIATMQHYRIAIIPMMITRMMGAMMGFLIWMKKLIMRRRMRILHKNHQMVVISIISSKPLRATIIIIPILLLLLLLV